ncbi:MAG: DUF378 domain-containing protein [Pseudomonadota bacterium]
MDSNILKAVAFIILLVGGINSGLMGLFDFNLLHLFGTFLYRIILIFVGASAGYLIYMRFVKKTF